MSVCDSLTTNASAGVAPALRAVDCLSNEATANAFARLFGGNGMLLPALTILLTLYIGLFAMALLTGRTRIGIASLTPRMVTLGLVLTFATSWVAYQQVVWNLAVGAPDQLAGILMGTGGHFQQTATQLFADRIDMVFAAIAKVAAASGEAAAGAADAANAAAASNTLSPANLMWLAAILLMLGTVGVLITARIALAVLLALGPVFVVFALFNGTRGLTAGWLRGVVLTALTPLFVIFGGSLMLELAVPVIAQLGSPNGVDARSAFALFLIAAVHVALMALMFRTATTITNAWHIFGTGGNSESRADRGSAPQTTAFANAAAATQAAVAHSGRNDRAVAITGAAAAMGSNASQPAPDFGGNRTITHIHPTGPTHGEQARRRARGIGNRFACPTPIKSREFIR
jgi:type IV secretion system protein VirB6